MAARTITPEALKGFSLRQAMLTAAQFDPEGRMPEHGQAVGLSTCRWDENYAPAKVISDTLAAQVPGDVRHLFHGGSGAVFLPLPTDLQQRATITQLNTGAQLVGDGPSQQVIDALRPAPLLDALGVRTVQVTSGSNFAIGIGDGAAVGWVTDGTGPAAPSIGSTLAKTCKAHTLISLTEISRQQLLQVTDRAEEMLLTDLMRGVSDGLEAAVFAGTGASGQPEGILSATGINSTVYAGASPTRAELLSQLDDLATDGVSLPAVQWAVNPAEAVKLYSVVDAASRPVFDGREMFGLPVRISTNVPAGKILAGDFSQVTMPMWGRLEVSRSESVRPDFCERFRVVGLTDVAILRPQAFSVGSVT